MTSWYEGQRCLVIELNGVNRKPKWGGAVLRATVEKVGRVYVLAALETGEVMRFWRRNGLQAHNGDFKWQLVERATAHATRRGGR